MMTLGILIIFGGYTVASYGVVLIKGYDISFGQWINPLSPLSWPAPNSVPATQIFPNQAVGVTATTGTTIAEGANPANVTTTGTPVTTVTTEPTSGINLITP